jgi:endoglucanase
MPFGILTGAGGEALARPHRFEPSPAATALRHDPDSLGVPLPFLATPPAADATASYSLADTSGAPAPQPTTVWRKSKIVDTARVAPAKNELVVQHDIFLALESPLQEGATYTVETGHADLPPVTFTYDTATLRSEAVHVSQIGFRPDDPLKTGYLSMWLGASPADPLAPAAVSYALGTPFRLLDTSTGEVVFEGAAALDEPREALSNLRLNYNLTDVSPRLRAFDGRASTSSSGGRRHLLPFRLGRCLARRLHDGHAASTTSGAASPSTRPLPMARPRSLHPEDASRSASRRHAHGYRPGLNLLGPEQLRGAGGRGHGRGRPNPGAAGTTRATGTAGAAHARRPRPARPRRAAPAFAAATSLAIPEAGDAIPDLIDEALWTVDFYARLQKPDGGVPGGIEATSYPPLGETSWTSSQDFFLYAPDAWSSYLHAGTAARAALLVEPHDPVRAQGYALSAIRAMGWAEANTPDHAAGHVDDQRPQPRRGRALPAHRRRDVARGLHGELAYAEPQSWRSSSTSSPPPWSTRGLRAGRHGPSRARHRGDHG